MSTHLNLLTALCAALAAGEEILKIYRTDFTVQQKQDQSPLTLADQNAHAVISRYLEPTGFPVLSEEGRAIPFAERRNWSTLWIVDPLDGTKEFVKRNDEFTVNIALARQGRPVLGVVFVPVKDRLYFAEEGLGAFRVGEPELLRQLRQLALPLHATDETRDGLTQVLDGAQRLPLEAGAAKPFTIVGSRSHASDELKAYVEAQRREHGTVEFVSAGSSLKFCLVAEGQAHLYPRLGPTCEWDTAAGQAVCECAGAQVVHHDTDQPLVYNKPDILNPWFIVRR